MLRDRARPWVLELGIQLLPGSLGAHSVASLPVGLPHALFLFSQWGWHWFSSWKLSWVNDAHSTFKVPSLEIDDKEWDWEGAAEKWGKGWFQEVTRVSRKGVSRKKLVRVSNATVKMSKMRTLWAHEPGFRAQFSLGSVLCSGSRSPELSGWRGADSRC